MLAALLLAGSTAAAAPAACPIERSAYVLRGQPGFTAEFHPVVTNDDWPLGVALAIHAAKTHRSYWFLPWGGGTDGRVHVRWVRVAGDNLDRKSLLTDWDFLSTDGAYTFLSAQPAKGDAAPMHFVMPGFARQLWHATAIEERDDMVQAFFDLTTCRAKPNVRIELTLPKVA